MRKALAIARIIQSLEKAENESGSYPAEGTDKERADILSGKLMFTNSIIKDVKEMFGDFVEDLLK